MQKGKTMNNTFASFVTVANARPMTFIAIDKAVGEYHRHAEFILEKVYGVWELDQEAAEYRSCHNVFNVTKDAIDVANMIIAFSNEDEYGFLDGRTFDRTIQDDLGNLVRIMDESMLIIARYERLRDAYIESRRKYFSA